MIPADPRVTLALKYAVALMSGRLDVETAMNADAIREHIQHVESVADQITSLSAQLEQRVEGNGVLHVCREGHEEIAHRNHDQCPLCQLRSALRSIADSSCCGCCQEAALFAKAALLLTPPEAPHE